MRMLARFAVAAILVAGLSSAVASARAIGKPAELPMSDLLKPSGVLTALPARITYQASDFPVPLRLTTPDATWAGAQWKSHSDRYGGGPPFYGWASVGQGVLGPPHGLLLIMTACARTPSVAATVAGLRTRGVGATYQDTSPVKLDGFSGRQFDCELDRLRHPHVT